MRHRRVRVWTEPAETGSWRGMTDDLTRHETYDLPDGFTLLPWHRGFGRQIGPLFERQDPGGLIRAFRVEDHHTNGMMNSHGGMLTAFADLAWGTAVERTDDDWWVTVRLVCDFLYGAKLGSWVEGRGQVVGVTDDIYTVEGRIWCGEKTLLRGTGVFKIIERRD